jgi:hypothetical protein
LCLHQRKVVADTLAWPTIKGEVGEAWPPLRAFGEEALWLNTSGLLQNCGWRWTTYGLSMTIVPAGICYPPIY